MNASVDQSLLLLTCLERFEKQSNEIKNRNELVELFCTQVIPLLTGNSLLDALRKHWAREQDRMNSRVAKTEAKALEEIKATADEIRVALGDPGTCPNETILEKVALIQRLISGEEKWLGSPLYQILYDELKQLLELLANAGYIDLCRPYAKLASHKIYVRIDPNQGEKWVKVLKNGCTTKVLSADELEAARKEDESDLLQLPPDYHLVDETYVDEFTFAPTVLEAYAAIDAVQWNRSQHPAIVWWYFETALWCWKTTDLYFNEVIRPKNGSDPEKHFQTTCEQATWMEIADARDGVTGTRRSPVIFTMEFFRTGLRTLTNAIASHLSQDPAITNIPPQEARQCSTTFELVLDGNELWVHVGFKNQSIEKFFIQRFNETADPAGSHLYQFVKKMLRDPGAGSKKAKLSQKWESASKHINRLHLPERLKQLFFEKMHGSCFEFAGASLTCSTPVDITAILPDLRKRHLTSYKN